MINTFLGTFVHQLLEKIGSIPAYFVFVLTISLTRDLGLFKRLYFRGLQEYQILASSKHIWNMISLKTNETFLTTLDKYYPWGKNTWENPQALLLN